MEKLILVIVLISLMWTIQGQVVLNEIYYDHPGSDTGYEWVEIYNISNERFNLCGWKLEKAGQEFEEIYEFEDVWIEGNGYLVVGEAEVNFADIICGLLLQNGGSATDGVRLLSADSLFTDTILYDEPNLHNLPDDLGNIGSSFAEDVPEGYSLGRLPDGLDTNSGSDWQGSHHPSPGSANILSIDLSILESEIKIEEGNLVLYTGVENLSTEGVDNSAGSIDIYLNSVPFESCLLPVIEGSGEWRETFVLTEENEGYHQVKIHLNSIYDSNLENNNHGCSLLIGLSAIRLTELMIKPLSSGCEWVELLVDSSVDNFVDNLYITDAAGAQGSFASASLLTGYQLVSDDLETMTNSYGISEGQLVICDNLPGLNNGGDTVYLEDEWGTILDNVSYGSIAGSEAGISWERKNPYDPGSDWGHSIGEAGHTAGSENSIMNDQIDLAIYFEGLEEVENGILHRLRVENLGYQEDINALLVVSWEEENGWESGSASEELLMGNEPLLLEILTEYLNSGSYIIAYELQVENDSDLSNNRVETVYSKGNFPWVINEIMYQPETGEPEWLEIKRNQSVAGELLVIVDTDSCLIEFSGEYCLLTNTESDKEYLESKHGEDLEIYTGLGRLSDEGEKLSVKHSSGSLIEEFNYLPEWNQKMRGVSIERINPQLPATANNWSSSVCGSTPGAENSVYTEIPSVSRQLLVSPPVFNPVKGEQAAISYMSESSLNIVKFSIFDLKGRLLRKLADQEYQSQEGIYFWDGRNSSGEIVRPGIYIILLESKGSGRNFEDKATVVVKN